MSIETHVHRALDAVAAEREVVEGKLRAFDRFEGRLADVAVEGPATPSRSAPVAGTRQIQGHANGGNGARAVRKAFAETVGPYCATDGNDESTLATLQSEFGESVAVALAPTTALR